MVCNKCKISKLLRKILIKLLDYIVLLHGNQRRINISTQKGDNIYIIRRLNTKSGFFSNFMYILGHIIYCDFNGYTPVIDMKNYKTPYNEKVKILDTFNAWEYYFLQPNSKISLAKAYRSKNAILSANKYLYEYVECYDILDKERIKYLNSFIKKYIHIRKEIEEEIETEYSIIKDNEYTRILGVHIRGTDMISTKDHPHPPTIDDYIIAIQEELNIRVYNKILVCSDDENYIRRLTLDFGHLIVTTNSYRSRDAINPPHHLVSDRELHHFNLGKEVLRDMIFLSKVESLICCHSNVSMVAIIYNNGKYDNLKILVTDKDN